MSKIIRISVVIFSLACFSLVACSSSSVSTEETKANSSAPSEEKDTKPTNNRFEKESVDNEGHTFVFTDKETNVQYLVVRRNSGYDGGLSITPILKADGSPYKKIKTSSSNRFEKESVDDEGHTFVFIDKETKVQYLVVRRNSGYDGGLSITPILNADGTLYIAKESEKQ
ncbi:MULTISPECIES: DUF6440 family protein [unclassified Bacillus (in: firmicutes)]|uniref:DUF6440 family protein n=1 Tax=unclassified Bacillus (in: firmicutes) TaxID=185979 RepID=UPI00227E3F40|nr:DUF6440 family protein [Bacillus sp. T9C1]